MMGQEETPCIMSFRLRETGMHRPLIKLDSAALIIAALERSGHVVIGLREIRLDGDGFAEFDGGMVSVPALQVSQTERTVDVGRLGQIFERPAELTNSRRPVALPECHKTLLVMGLPRSNAMLSFGGPARNPGHENRQERSHSRNGRSS